MKWKCAEDGCFNDLKRPALGLLDSSLPGSVGFTDVDGMVELNGSFLMLEFKGPGVPLPTGQQIMFRRLTRGGRRNCVFVVEGDAHRMDFTVIKAFRGGADGPWEKCTLGGLRRMVSEWAAEAERG